MKSYEGWSPDAGLDFIATLHPKVFIYMRNTMIYMAPTEKNLPGSYISCRMSENDVKQLDNLVGNGEYMNRSDVIRSAIREFLRTR